MEQQAGLELRDRLRRRDSRGIRVRTEERATLLVDQEHPKVLALYQSWEWQPLGDLRSRLPHAPLFHAMLLPLRAG
ncbi:hypothetical protein OIE62_00675 [Streptomyces scopuliridis]|uniref:hypothetical protein n=1 Tax=Streptomyces scopuliridis TaxID=452529 RepID=UPI002DDC6624|nr:hypothetical protein [Streptomyces scopuliridis]WSB38330.1 hypothetical protein OG949_39630 [Streptomyces scopuliridis]WSC03698.1 hypothetical protein OIE62_00675 [Streptomyces scopuliridis]